MSFSSTAIEPLRFREALGHYASGITVITSDVEGEPVGFTCQSFHSVPLGQ
ncbi:flavin reductase family protein [Pusillimonas sp. MFBS29]|uniref:flavin reductase family protein n=1 Tax=Pusillimonas sp. MFBS29 TaxID=2886690 RepID=UPI001D11274C|nr:flavin reductase family protein [Pusillimonas sp. MFBS29]MCC2595703.1 flavin reductase family protein [Pusillimonas sp. MFBS29]